GAPPRPRARGRSRHRSQARDAARRSLARELRAADEEPGGERVARAGRVDDLACGRRKLLVADGEAARAPLDHPRRGPDPAPERLPLLLVAEDDVRSEPLQSRAEAAAADRRPRGEVDAEAAGPERRGGLRRLGDRAREQAVPGEVEPVAVREP